MILSVVIPTFHRTEMLRACLDHLLPEVQGIDRGSYEVIVADDGYLPDSKAMIEQYHPWVTWVKGPARGPAANRNHGAALAKTNWIVFTDDDCLPSNDWLKNLMILMQNQHIDVIEGLTKADRPQQSYEEESPINLTGNRLWSCNFAIRKSLFFELEGFDERFPFPAMEDVDFHHRLINHGAQIVFDKGVIVVHPWRKRGGLKKIHQAYASHRYFYRKHFQDKKLVTWYSLFKMFVGSILFDFPPLNKLNWGSLKHYFLGIYFSFRMLFMWI